MQVIQNISLLTATSHYYGKTKICLYIVLQCSHSNLSKDLHVCNIISHFLKKMLMTIHEKLNITDMFYEYSLEQMLLVKR